jgi:hypothetical protein
MTAVSAQERLSTLSFHILIPNTHSALLAFIRLKVPLHYITLHAPLKREWEPQSGANERLIGGWTLHSLHSLRFQEAVMRLSTHMYHHTCITQWYTIHSRQYNTCFRAQRKPNLSTSQQADTPLMGCATLLLCIHVES